ncbi:MAG TPA: 16S rRNA (adenine(1518)-N(6)/adenine(1519)-N(6))-dimethyltransferase RsmA [Anaerolineaceae bacterium]|nr:16S rRNA (adenine(1518)-N(6)/adenine(1519)-N(6))-dimethyltransferase RsmA [Anaerolineaceae bacterium]
MKNRNRQLSPLDVPGLLRNHGLRPNRRLGQNFLADDGILGRVVEVAEVGPEDEVVEVGPGLGSLTRHLALAARAVTAVELDRQFIPVLDEVLSGYQNVRVIQGDILKLKPGDLVRQAGYLVVANIPYYITSALIRHLLEATIKPARMVLTVQQEVAERICAQPGEMSQLALSVQVYGRPRIAARIPAGAFYPAPEVDSSVLRLDLYPAPAIPAELLDVFFQLMKAGFSQKRKTLRNTLAAGLRIGKEQAAALLLESGIDPQRRAETLGLEEWGRLAEKYRDFSIEHTQNAENK